MKKNFTLILLFLFPLTAFAQNYQLSGSIEIANSRLDLVPSVISVNDDNEVSGLLLTPYYQFYFDPMDNSDGLKFKNDKFIGSALGLVLGQISFTSEWFGTNTPSEKQTDKDYGVFLENNVLKGYAWNDLMGWICFGDCINSDAQVSMQKTDKNLTVVPFLDLGPKQSFAFEALQFLKEEGIVQGYSDGHFNPENEVNRAEVLKMIFAAYPQDDSEIDLPFFDVEKGAWYEKYLKMAYQAEIVKGYADNTYKPGQSVNRAEFYKILLTAADQDLPENDSDSVFEDVKESDWYLSFANFAQKKELYFFENEFSASQPVTRLEVAYALYKLLNK